jgi:hypothetical protein
MKQNVAERGRFVAQVGISGIVVFSALTLAADHGFYQLSLKSEFLWLCLASMAIIHLSVRPKWTEAGLLATATGLLCAVEFGLMGMRAKAECAFALFGLASLAIMGLRMVWSGTAAARLWFWAFVPGLLFVGFGWLTPPLLEYGQIAHPKVLDLYLYSFDCSLRFQPSFLVGLLFVKLPWLRVVCYFFYLGLAVPIAAVYAGHLVRNQKRALPIMLALLYTGPIGGMFYSLFPALGPAHLFHQNFPLHPLSIEQARHLLLEALPLPGYRNAIPSLHMGWVLLAWWYCRGLSKWTKAVVLAFVFFTVLATLGSGEHYLIDLVVAFPFCVMIQGLFAFSLKWNNRCRLVAIFGGLATLLGWIWALRFVAHLFWASPSIPWGLVIATIAVSVWWQKSLQRALVEVSGKYSRADEMDLTGSSDCAFSSSELIHERR